MPSTSKAIAAMDKACRMWSLGYDQGNHGWGFAVSEDGSSGSGFICAKYAYLEKPAPPDSWEKLEEDVQKVAETDDTCAYFDKQGKYCDGCPAADIPDLCLVVVLRDVVRRAKALAGRDTND